MTQLWQVQALSPARDGLGESPCWDLASGCLWWVDFYGPRLQRWHPSEGVRSWRLPGREAGAVVSASSGKLLIALDEGLVTFDPASGGTLPFADPNQGRFGLGYNDAKVDRQGNLWAGTWDRGGEPRALLFRVAADGCWQVADGAFPVCNGPAFSPDGTTLYFSDTDGGRLLAYALAGPGGKPVSRRLFARIEGGQPDGLTVDAEGCLWCAVYGGGALLRFRPDGSLERRLTLPVPLVTSCCFGGPDLRRLFVTTARSGLDAAALAAAPLSGALLALDTDLEGLPERPFG